MRAGGAYHRVKFFEKQVTRDDYGASHDSWDYNNPTITTRGEIRYTGGTKTLSNEEKFYAKSVELIVRYRSDITETMKVQIDGTNDLWDITYKEELGRKESLRLTIEKCADGLGETLVDAPTGFITTLSEVVNVILTWTSTNPVSIERSEDGNSFAEIARTIDETYTDEDLDELTRYYYRIRAYLYYDYSDYTQVEIVTTEEEV